jgi:NADPH:quinone reductase-like Zn-dependent oxidoreductase
MFAVYASKPNLENPLSSLVIGERPEPEIPEGWERVKVTHASLNRHDIFTLMGRSGQSEPIPFPMILGNDGSGVLDDGTEVIIYPVLGSPDWRGDETHDPHWHVVGELVQGTMADYVVLPRRNLVPRPEGISLLDGSLLGTAWLTAYRALFCTSGVKPGGTVLVQGASGGMSTALMQLGRAAGIEIWVTSRNEEGHRIAEKLGARKIFRHGEKLPRKVDAVIDNVGAATWNHSLESVKRGGTVVINGVTTGFKAETNLLRLSVESISIKGAIMGTLDEMESLISFIIETGIKPEVGTVAPMTDAKEHIGAMIAGETHGKTIFTR